MKRSTKVLVAAGGVVLVVAVALTLGSAGRAVAAGALPGFVGQVPVIGRLGCLAQADLNLTIQKDHCEKTPGCYWSPEHAALVRTELARIICAGQAGR